MMLVLGIDTSTSTGSVALVGDAGLVAEYALTSARTHSERLLGAVDWLLKEAAVELHALEGLAVGLGPGSFTGLRIGLTTMKTLAAGLSRPLVGVPTLDALAWNVHYTDYQVCPLLDARKKEVYAALYRFEFSPGKIAGEDPVGGASARVSRQIKLTPDLVIDPKKLISIIHAPTIFLGEGLRLYQNLLAEALGESALFAPPPAWVPRASTVAYLGREKLLQGKADNLQTLVPLYVRPSEAEFKQVKVKG